MSGRVVLATSNQGKFQEFQEMLGDSDLDLELADKNALIHVEEDGLSFIENALIKARAAAQYSGQPTLADDSGLSVHCLAGRPGIHSARYAGEPSNDAANNQKLLRALENSRDRAATFVCALVYLRHANDPDPVFAVGRWHGCIALAGTGTHGFGYDPLFLDPELQITAAQMTSHQKNQRSHRAQAVRTLIQELEARQP